MIIKLVILIYISTISYSQNNRLIDISEKCEFQENFLPRCFHKAFVRNQTELIFKDNSPYQLFGEKYRMNLSYKDCSLESLPEIDFTKFNMLSTWTAGGGCSANYKRQIFQDTKNKRIIYEVSPTYNGQCEMLIGNWNWAIVPKISDAYTIEFIVKQN